LVSTVFLSEEKLIDELANALNALFEEQFPILYMDVV
jgi:hypothetical protein